MTKVTVEMLQPKVTVESAKDALAYFNDEYFPYIHDFSDEYDRRLFVILSIARRVIEPGEDVVERCARAICSARGLKPDYEVATALDPKKPMLAPQWKVYCRAARTVLASLTQGEGEKG